MKRKGERMIGITLDVERIDYDKSVEGLLPSVLGWIAGNEKLREADKFLKKLGPDAVPAQGTADPVGGGVSGRRLPGGLPDRGVLRGKQTGEPPDFPRGPGRSPLCLPARQPAGVGQTGGSGTGTAERRRKASDLSPPG